LKQQLYDALIRIMERAFRLLQSGLSVKQKYELARLAPIADFCKSTVLTGHLENTWSNSRYHKQTSLSSTSDTRQAVCRRWPQMSDPKSVLWGLCYKNRTHHLHTLDIDSA
ncbi:MAG: hypothetical protein K8F91_19360, partial [Candidatus Obscuribacterales bacterium]|nr:hypothetical protein [Candidatus Obscuribacterales bacterium]